MSSRDQVVPCSRFRFERRSASCRLRRRFFGFTLLELLLVMVLMVMITSVVVPQFSKSMTSFQLRDSTRQTVAILNRTRNVAISESREATFTIDKDARVSRSTATTRAQPWPDQVDIEIDNYPVPESRETMRNIVFYPDGTSTGGHIVVSSSKNSYVIIVDWLTGHVNVRN